MKVILGFCAFLGVLDVAGWIADHITGGMILALVIVLWLGFVGWMIRGYRDSVKRQKEDNQRREKRTVQR